jgi:chromosome partitioning protein
MAATIITVAQQKGGAGKTTLAANLAIAYAQANNKVAVVDIDPQRSLTMWHALRQALHGEDSDITVVPVGGWKLATELDQLRRDHDIVVIDSPPHAETDARIAVRQAQLVVIPVQPSPMDVWATEPILAVAQKEKAPVLLVLNRVPPRALLTATMITRLGQYKVRVAKSTLGNRVAFAESIGAGRTVLETKPHSVAAAEVRHLAAEILRRL